MHWFFILRHHDLHVECTSALGYGVNKLCLLVSELSQISGGKKTYIYDAVWLVLYFRSVTTVKNYIIEKG